MSNQTLDTLTGVPYALEGKVLTMDDAYVGVIEHTNYEPPSEYQGRHLIYVSNHRKRDDPRFHMRASELLTLYTPHLKRINPAFDVS